MRKCTNTYFCVNTLYARIEEKLFSPLFSVPAQCFSLLFVGLYYTELQRDKIFA